MDHRELLNLYDSQLRVEIEHPGARKETFPDLVRFTKPWPGMNFVSYSRIEPGNLDQVIREQVAHFAPLRQPFSWHVCDHDRPENLKDRLLAHGFVGDDDPDAVMVLDVRDAPAGLLRPASADIRPATQPDQLDAVAEIEKQVLGGDFTWLSKRLGEHLRIKDYVGVYLAYSGERPACAGWAYFHPQSQFTSLFGGATLPDFRRRGLYTAVLAVRVQEAIRRGYRFVSTGASPMSRPILARNGFRLLTYAHALEWKGGDEPPGQPSSLRS